MATQASFLSSASFFNTQPISTKRPPHRRHYPKTISSLNKPVIKEPVFPITINNPVSVTVQRPKKARSKKEDEEVVLLVEDIVFDRQESVQFDVYINSSEEESQEMFLAGTFLNMPQKHGGGKEVNDLKTKNLRLEITDFFEDLKAEDDDSVVVSLVPMTDNGNKVKVGGLRIEYSS